MMLRLQLNVFIMLVVNVLDLVFLLSFESKKTYFCSKLQLIWNANMGVGRGGKGAVTPLDFHT